MDITYTSTINTTSKFSILFGILYSPSQPFSHYYSTHRQSWTCDDLYKSFYLSTSDLSVKSTVGKVWFWPFSLTLVSSLYVDFHLYILVRWSFGKIFIYWVSTPNTSDLYINSKNRVLSFYWSDVNWISQMKEILQYSSVFFFIGN